MIHVYIRISLTFSSLGKMDLREFQRLFDLFVTDEFDELLLLQVKVKIAIIVQQLGMNVVHQRDGFLDTALRYGEIEAIKRREDDKPAIFCWKRRVLS